jgi:DNA-binding response OmpR family regulator
VLVSKLLRQRILVVDGEEDSRGLIGWVFHDQGCEVDLAADGSAALAKMATHRPDLVLLELVMPGLDGWAVLAHLRDLPDPPPVVIMTACSDIASFTRATREGVAGYVLKPFRVWDFVATCHRILQAHQRAPRSLEADRRREPRRLLALDARTLVEGEPPMPWSKLIDLSPSGAQLDLASALEPGDRVRVAFYMADGETPFLTLEGRIRWRSSAPAGFAHGVLFEGLAPEAAQQVRTLVFARGH